MAGLFFVPFCDKRNCELSVTNASRKGHRLETKQSKYNEVRSDNLDAIDLELNSNLKLISTSHSNMLELHETYNEFYMV